MLTPRPLPTQSAPVTGGGMVLVVDAPAPRVNTADAQRYLAGHTSPLPEATS